MLLLVSSAFAFDVNRQKHEYDPELDIPITSEPDSLDAVIIKAVEIPEEQVTYEGAQVWRVEAEDDKTEFVSYLQETGGKLEIFVILL